MAALSQKDTKGKIETGCSIKREGSKIYHLFAGHDYYPGPALGDYVGVFNTIGEAKDKLTSCGYQWYAIVNISKNGKLQYVEKYGSPHGEWEEV